MKCQTFFFIVTFRKGDSSDYFEALVKVLTEDSSDFVGSCSYSLFSGKIQSENPSHRTQSFFYVGDSVPWCT